MNNFHCYYIMSFSPEVTYYNYNTIPFISNNLPKVDLRDIYPINDYDKEYKINGVVYPNSWQPESGRNDELLEANQIKNNSDYRKLITNNADNIMKININSYKKSINLN